MNKLFLVFFCITFFLSMLTNSAQAGRNITLPFTESFNTNNYSDLIWVTDGATHAWQSSGCWSGGCAKFTPPYGPNQGYSGLGQFTNLSGTQLNVRFLIYYGSTYYENAANNKLIILNRLLGARPMIIEREHSSDPYDGNPYPPYMTIGPCDGTVCKYYGGDYWPDGTDTYRIGNRPQHREQEWISIEIEANTSTGNIRLYIHTSDGVLSGLYQTQTMATLGSTWTHLDILGGYFGENGTADANNYFMIDELRIASSYIGPPSGFLSVVVPSAPGSTR